MFASSGLSGPVGMAFDSNGIMYVANQGDNTVHKFGPTGTDLGTFASTGLNGPIGIAFDPSGNLFVANFFGGTIHEFGPTGTDLGTFASTPNGIGPAFLVFAVPEPTSALLIAFGTFGLPLVASFHRRRMLRK